MAIDSVSSLSGISERMRAASKEIDARQSAPTTQVSSASQTAQTARASTSDSEASLQASTTQIARAYSSGSPSAPELRTASEAYQQEAAARDQIARQSEGNGSRSVDVTA
jgi:hypothetical protein